MTECVPATPEAVARAAALLRAGEVVAFPTETVYGLGADATSDAAVRRIFAAKERPADNPLIVHVADAEQVAPLVRAVDARARALMARFWPGPLTLIMARAACVAEAVSPGLDTVSVRLPAHPAARALIRAAGLPIAAPSANRSGRPSPTTAAHVLADMAGRIPLILDGGPCAVGVESTVLDVSGGVPVILRPGGVTVEMLRAVLGEVRVDESALAPLAEGVAPRSPGMKYKHYAPQAEVRIAAGSPRATHARLCALYDRALAEGGAPLILTPAERCPAFAPRRARAWGSAAQPEAAAAQLFAALREADAEGATLILAEAVDTQGIGLAVMNRLGRAAGFQVLQCDEDA